MKESILIIVGFLVLSCATTPVVEKDGTIIDETTVENRGDIIKQPGISSQFLDKDRNLTIYLPQNYELSDKYYPVIYFHDGNNLFTKYSSPGHRWKLEKLLDYLIEESLIPEVIVIGIGNTGNRESEYVPYVIDPGNPPPLADEYLKFVVEELKPQIDQDYRTKSESENTIIAGSSSGGLISLYAGLKYPEIFGKILAFSPSLYPGEEGMMKDFANSADQTSQKFYIDMGGNEDPRWKDYIVDSLFRITPEIEKRIGEENLKVVLEPFGTHDEIAWERRFPDAAVWIFQ